jgi:protein MAK16
MYLNIKTIERAHLPKKLWEAIELSKNTKEALDQIEENLQWWPRNMVVRCKVRYLRIKQYLHRMRRLALDPGPKLVHIKKKEERVLYSREAKAHRIAALEPAIEKELLKRLREGVYDSQIPLNIPEEAFNTLIDQELDKEEREKGKSSKKSVQINEVPEIEDYYQAAEDDEDDENEEEVARMLDGLDDYDDQDDDDEEEEEAPDTRAKGKRKHVEVGAGARKGKKKPKMEYEKEVEHENSRSLKQLMDW